MSKMNIVAAEGEPDGRKADWLENVRVVVGNRKVG